MNHSFTDAERDSARAHAMKMAAERIAAGEPLDGMVRLVWRTRTLPGGEVEETGPYLIPQPARTEPADPADKMARWHTLFDVSQGWFRL